MRTAHTSVKWVLGEFSPCVEQSKHEDAIHLHLSSEVMNAWKFTSILSYSSKAYNLPFTVETVSLNNNSRKHSDMT